MSRHIHTAIILAGLLLPLSLCAQDDDVKAAVDVSIQQDHEIWAGQQVTVNLDLKTTGFSFSNTHFNIPEVSGAFLMQTDTTTIKLTETINGQSWQIIRYPIALFPQKAGKLEIPPIDVRFTTSAGFGSTDKAFEFQTEVLELSVSLPPGVKEGDLVVSTNSFELEYDWHPETTTAHAGDAFTLTVSRRASDISAMLLPPLPVFNTQGLAAYPQAPEVNDKTNRGDLTGERKDTIIWVVEKPGSYEIPGIRFQWWDPNSHDLKQQIVPGLKLDILPSPMDRAVLNPVENIAGTSRNVPQIVIFVFAVLLSGILWWRFGFKARKQAPDNEKMAFTGLQKACKNNDPGQAYINIHTWLEYSTLSTAKNLHPITLSEFARICKDKQLTDGLEDLQQALVTGSESWQGGSLFSALQRIRKLRKQKADLSETRLAPLNP